MCLLKTERQICIPAGNMHTLAISAFFIFLSRLCQVSAAARGSSLVVPSRRYSLGVVLLTVWCSSLRAASLLQSAGAKTCGLQQLWFPGSRSQAQQLRHTGSTAPQCAGSSQTRDRNHVSCTARFFTTELPGKSLFLIIYN